MRSFYLAITAAILAIVVTSVTAQEQTTGVNVSPAQTAIDRAAAANKYTFIFFWKEKGQQTDNAWNVFQPAAAKLADSADVVSIQITDAAEKKIVEKYGVIRAPMPMALSIAPCGAITKGFTKKFDETELRTAFVSPCMQLCLKALQGRKLVLACVVDQANPQDPVEIPQGVRDFKDDKKFGPATEIILVNAKNQEEAALLKDFKVDSKMRKPVVVFLAPPGAMIGRYDGSATKQQLLAQLAAAQSNPCAGGKCGPGGCGPKK